MSIPNLSINECFNVQRSKLSPSKKGQVCKHFKTLSVFDGYKNIEEEFEPDHVHQL
eukprot:CAMPEP_0168349284 /NCGR_PEP_ID=MMETSP0213-20121227/20313_1 /TAXON_ID=151035 /ORGANISM="Euplotes harpa, Strain FSP1.4" /LENGTH=55 /DNA_ID=CAMNT_0008359173 /DNA_START=295 /DNA_END=459 /DNA_ORIENTATION=+